LSTYRTKLVGFDLLMPASPSARSFIVTEGQVAYDTSDLRHSEALSRTVQARLLKVQGA